MESQRNGSSFTPVDPFKASIGFSIKNIWQRRGEAANDEANNIYLRPTAPARTLTLADLPLFGASAPFRFPVGHDPHLSPNLPQRRAPSLALYGPGSFSSLGTNSVYDAEPVDISSDSPIDEHTSSAVHSPNPQQSIVPSRLSSASVRTTSNPNDTVLSPRYSPIQAPMHNPTSAVPPLKIESYGITTYFLAFVLDTVPRQIYLYLLLRLPYMYFSRVTRIFEEAEMSMPQIKQGILEMAMQMREPLAQPWVLERSIENIPFKNLQITWQAFIDSLLREWKTLNIISVLLLSAILTILQIEDASKDPLTRYAALISMICALMSLLYGCIYIIRFGTMRKSYKAAEWANEAQKTRQSIMWNIWVLLAMPATWLAWSIILFIVCIMSFVWRTGTVEDDSEEPMTRDQVLVARIIVTLVLSLGLVYLVLMIVTLRRYGEMMDQAWYQRILGWVNDTLTEKVPLVSEKVTGQSVPAVIPLDVSNSAPMNSPTGIRSWATNIAPAPNPNPISSHKAKENTTQTVLPASRVKTGNIVDNTAAVSSSGLEVSLHPQEHHKQLRTEVEESENRPKSPRGIEMMELYSISNLPNSNDIDITMKNLSGSDGNVWNRLPHDGWDILRMDLLLSWEADSPERILPTLDKFNQTSAETIGGQLALCQEIRSDKSKYAIFFFAFMDPLPQEQSCYGSIPFDLDCLDIWLSLPSAPSSSLDSRIETKHMKVSLLSKRSTDNQTASIITCYSSWYGVTVGENEVI